MCAMNGHNDNNDYRLQFYSHQQQPVMGNKRVDGRRWKVHFSHWMDEWARKLKKLSSQIFTEILNSLSRDLSSFVGISSSIICSTLIHFVIRQTWEYYWFFPARRLTQIRLYASKCMKWRQNAEKLCWISVEDSIRVVTTNRQVNSIRLSWRQWSHLYMNLIYVEFGRGKKRYRPSS